MAERQRCRGRTQSGRPCRSPVTDDSGLCPAHREGGHEHMIELASRGGAAAQASRVNAGLPAELLGPLELVDDAKRWLQEIARAVGERRIRHNEGRAMQQAVSAWLEADSEQATRDVIAENRRLREQLDQRPRPRVIR